MINNLNKTNEVFLHVSVGPDVLKIQPGDLSNIKAFDPKHTILVPKNNPEIFWNLLHDMIGIPKFGEKISKPEQVVEKENPRPENHLEEKLKKLKAVQIVEKVKKEKGVDITISLKSKAAIIKKALQIY